MGDYYRRPYDSRNLNYNNQEKSKKFDSNSIIEEYSSGTQKLLTKEEVIDLIKKANIN